MNILIFGGNGFLGAELKKQFSKTSHTCITVSRNSPVGHKVDISRISEFSILPVNFFDIVINCATILPGGEYLDNDYLNKIYKTNILGTQNICKWISSQKSIKKLINCSTLAVVNRPWVHDMNEDAATYPTGNHVLYCSSKLMQELIINTTCTELNLNFLNIRFSSIYGENMDKSGIIWNLYNQARLNNEIKLINGNIISYDFISVTDAANIICMAVELDIEGGILNAASGRETSLFDLACVVNNNLPKSVTIRNEDLNISDTNFSIINITKLTQLMNTGDFISLDEGINKLLKVW